MRRPSRELRRDEISQDTPLRLDIAASLCFPDGTIGPSSLRREALRGRLEIWRIAGKDFTTLAAIGRMMDACRVDRTENSVPGRGGVRRSDDSVGVSFAVAACRLRAKRLIELSEDPKRSSAGGRPKRAK